MLKLTVSDIGDREQLKALLSEMKIMTHVGSHLNILNLLGAVTTEINKGISSGEFINILIFSRIFKM